MAITWRRGVKAELVDGYSTKVRFTCPLGHSEVVRSRMSRVALERVMGPYWNDRLQIICKQCGLKLVKHKSRDFFQTDYTKMGARALALDPGLEKRWREEVGK